VVALILAAAVAVPVHAQILKASPEGAPQKLFISILDGEGALNNIRQRDAREPVVQVTDENHKPVSGALVLFLIHNGGHGATATFNGAQSLTVTTGADGTAHGSGLQVGRNPGTYTIAVTATVGIIVATAVIHQSNVITALNSATQGTQGSGAQGSGTSGSQSSTTAGGQSSTTATGPSGGGGGHGHFHLGRTGKIVAGSAVVVAAVVAVVVVNQGGSTSLSLGSSTVGHP
jgi:hypothetical protein